MAGVFAAAFFAGAFAAASVLAVAVLFFAELDVFVVVTSSSTAASTVFAEAAFVVAFLAAVLEPAAVVFGFAAALARLPESDFTAESPVAVLFAAVFLAAACLFGAVAGAADAVFSVSGFFAAVLDAVAVATRPPLCVGSFFMRNQKRAHMVKTHVKSRVFPNEGIAAS